MNHHLSSIKKAKHCLRSPRELMKERAIGFANVAITITSRSDRTATCVIFLMSWVTKWRWCLISKEILESFLYVCHLKRILQLFNHPLFSNNQHHSLQVKEWSTCINTSIPTQCHRISLKLNYYLPQWLPQPVLLSHHHLKHQQPHWCLPPKQVNLKHHPLKFLLALRQDRRCPNGDHPTLKQAPPAK